MNEGRGGREGERESGRAGELQNVLQCIEYLLSTYTHTMCLASKHLLLYPVATWLRQVELRVYTIYFLHPYIHRSLLNINISWEKQETNEGWVVIVSEVRIVRSTRSILFYFIVLREGVSTTKNQEPRTKNLVCFLNQSTSHPWGLFLTWFYLPNHLFLLYSWCHIGPDLIKETQSIDRSINQ